MMIQGRPSSLSGIIQAQASSLSGLGDDASDLLDQGIDINQAPITDPSFPIDNGFGLPNSGSPPVTITAPSSNLIGQCAVTAADGSCQTYYAAPLATSSGGVNVPAGAAGSLASVLSSIFGSAASVANTALKSTTQTCQVINGQTVCTTSSTGGGSPTTSVAGLGGISTTTLMLLGIGVVALLAFGGKK